MQGRKPLVVVVSIVILLAVVSAGYQALTWHDNSGALWKIVSQKCVPGQQSKGDPAPCREVDLHNGFVVLKDRNGPLQFLLMPAERLSGIENPAVLNPATPNFFAEAWRARHYMEERYGKPIDEQVFSLAINSPWGRSQNQLHIHISCLRPDVRQQINAVGAQLTAAWQLLTLNNHQWQVRAITRDELKRKSPFMYLANEIPGAREEMGHYGIAIAALADGRRVMMVIQRNLLTMNRASAEEIQDHSCGQLYGTNRPSVMTP